MAILELNNLSHQYRKLQVLKNINLKINLGEFVSIVGPLGCGKTTLLKIISGLIKPSEGTIVFSPQKLTKSIPQISLTFQKDNLLPWLTVKENLKLPLIIKKFPKKIVKKNVQAVLEFIKLTKYQNFYPDQLSGGMEQLTAIARAFISPAQILLLDEPFAHLDEITREKMNLALARLWQNQKKTVILVTHYLKEAVFLADKVLLLGSKPATIKSLLKIAIPRPRSLKLLTTDKFNTYLKKFYNNLNNAQT